MLTATYWIAHRPHQRERVWQKIVMLAMALPRRSWETASGGVGNFLKPLNFPGACAKPLNFARRAQTSFPKISHAAKRPSQSAGERPLAVRQGWRHMELAPNVAADTPQNARRASPAASKVRRSSASHGMSPQQGEMCANDFGHMCLAFSTATSGFSLSHEARVADKDLSHPTRE